MHVRNMDIKVKKGKRSKKSEEIYNKTLHPLREYINYHDQNADKIMNFKVKGYSGEVSNKMMKKEHVPGNRSKCYLGNKLGDNLVELCL
jgi:hypothetical protein